MWGMRARWCHPYNRYTLGKYFEIILFQGCTTHIIRADIECTDATKQRRWPHDTQILRLTPLLRFTTRVIWAVATCTGMTTRCRQCKRHLQIEAIVLHALATHVIHALGIYDSAP